MRHLLLALMIALLPLRAWVGDAMAVSMLGHPAATAVAAASGDGHASCPDHAVPLASSPATGHAVNHSSHGAGDHSAETPDPGQVQDHHLHSACDVCNVPAIGAAQSNAAMATQVHTVLAHSSERFASFALQQGTKPPIS